MTTRPPMYVGFNDFSPLFTIFRVIVGYYIDFVVATCNNKDVVFFMVKFEDINLIASTIIKSATFTITHWYLILIAYLKSEVTTVIIFGLHRRLLKKLFVDLTYTRGSEQACLF